MKMKVFLALALFALMAVGVYAQTATAADFELTSGSQLQIIKYKGSATVVNIPSTIGNSSITVIQPKAFMDNTKITSVTIPSSVTALGSYSFSGCTSLTSINIPNGVTRIREGTFDGCTSLTSINIPNGVTSIDGSAFFNNPKLTSVTFSGSIPSDSFHNTAFDELGDLRAKYLAGGAGTYTRPDGKSTTWTKTAAAAAAAPAAAGTAGLAFTLTGDGKGYSVSNGTVRQGAVVIPATYNNLPVTTVANAGFNTAAAITSVIIPESVTNIQKAAFTGCANLNSVTFGRANTSFSATEFPYGGDLANKYKAGGAGTYTRSDSTWTKK